MTFKDLLYLLSVTKDDEARSIIVRELHYRDDVDDKELAKLQYNAIPDFDELLDLVMDVRIGAKTADEVMKWGISRERHINACLNDIVKNLL